MRSAVLALSLAALALAGCQTTQQAQQELGSRWIGRHVDEFFTQNGAPVSSFALQTGGTIYQWTGGNETRQEVVRNPAAANAGPGWSRTTGTSNTVLSGNTATTTSTSTTVGFNPAGLVAALTGPTVRTINYGCDAEIATNAQGIIQNIRLARDTTGMGLNMSRCAEVFGTGQR
jgi:hypothetical protein